MEQKTNALQKVQRKFHGMVVIFGNPEPTSTHEFSQNALVGWFIFPPKHLSNDNEKNPGCLGYIGDYTTQFHGDYNNPH